MSTYTPIASQTLSTSAPSVTFSSIPQGYTDLVLVFNGATNAGGNLALQFNSDTASNYSATILYGDGSSAGSARVTSQTQANVAGINTSNNTAIISIMNYSNSTTYKTALGRGMRTGDQSSAKVALWRSTAAITSMTVLPIDGASTWSTGSTFSIYGIQVGDKAQKAQGGNIVTTDGTYVYHTFTSSGAFIPSQALTADYLVVAGGGGGGCANGGGGGGAGGYRNFTSQSLTAGTSYTAIVGAGGAGVTSNKGTSGSTSTFNSNSSSGGGGGGASDEGTGLINGVNGGSGGGGGSHASTGGTGGTGNSGSYSPSEGSAGGTGISDNSGYRNGGGGGGSSAGSNNATSGAGGAGGAGTSNSISGSSLTYAGGGGGGALGGSTNGAGGSGGGGAGGLGLTVAINGTVNTGGGGGGAGGNSGDLAGAAGGSGVVIIRYLA